MEVTRERSHCRSSYKMPDYEETQIVLPDGYESYARYWPVSNPVGAVLYLHGIQSHCGWYEQSARALQQAQLAVCQPDRRGSGRNRQQRGHADSKDQLIEDAVVCGQQLLARCGATCYHVVAVSWSGRLACAMHLRESAPIASLSLVCPGMFPRVDVSGTEKFRIGLSMLGNPQQQFEIPLNNPDLFTNDPHWIRFLEEDPLRLHQVSACFFLATRRMDHVIRDLPKSEPLPVHVFLTRDDRIIDAPRTEKYFRDLNWPDLSISLYSGVRHTLEFESVREQYMDSLVEWILARS